MNDDEVMTLVRDQRDKLPLTIPVDQIITRGKAVRTRRRLIPGVAGGLAVAAGVVFAVSARASTSDQTNHPVGHARHQYGASTHPSTVRLAAWTVTEQANGNVSVTLRQLQDPAGLEATLRADGVPASVTFQPLNTSCQPYPARTTLLNQVFPDGAKHQPSPLPGARRMTRVAPGAAPPSPSVPVPGPDSTVTVINPSALPSHAGVQLASAPSRHAVALPIPRLVYTNSQMHRQLTHPTNLQPA